MTKCTGVDPYNFTVAPNVIALKGTTHSSCEFIDNSTKDIVYMSGMLYTVDEVE